MISTVCFAGVALVWFLYGMEYFKNDEKIKAAVYFCARFMLWVVLDSKLRLSSG